MNNVFVMNVNTNVETPLGLPKMNFNTDEEKRVCKSSIVNTNTNTNTNTNNGNGVETPLGLPKMNFDRR